MTARSILNDVSTMLKGSALPADLPKSGASKSEPQKEKSPRTPLQSFLRMMPKVEGMPEAANPHSDCGDVGRTPRAPSPPSELAAELRGLMVRRAGIHSYIVVSDNILNYMYLDPHRLSIFFELFSNTFSMCEQSICLVFCLIFICVGFCGTNACPDLSLLQSGIDGMHSVLQQVRVMFQDS